MKFSITPYMLVTITISCMIFSTSAAPLPGFWKEVEDFFKGLNIDNKAPE